MTFTSFCHLSKKRIPLSPSLFFQHYRSESRGPRPFSLLLIVGLNALVHYQLGQVMLGLLLSGSLAQALVPVLVYGGLFVLLRKMIGITKISKGSSYGDVKKKE